jgi:hypothetical protein
MIIPAKGLPNAGDRKKQQHRREKAAEVQVKPAKLLHERPRKA